MSCPLALVIGQNQAFGMLDVTLQPKYDLVNAVRAANIATLQSLGLLGTAPMLTSAPANGATYLSGGLVPGSWAQVKGTNLSDTSRIWAAADFANLGNALPTDLSGVQVLVNGTAAAVYYISPTQINFQVPAGVSGAASVQVTRDGLVSNAMSAPAVSSAPGIFPVIVNGTNYAAAVFTDGTIAGDPSVSSSFRNAKPGDAISLFATGLAPSAAGMAVSLTPLTGVDGYGRKRRHERRVLPAWSRWANFRSISPCRNSSRTCPRETIRLRFRLTEFRLRR